jgi:hypothetical protein
MKNATATSHGKRRLPEADAVDAVAAGTCEEVFLAKRISKEK